jgi:hypothetical protein
MQSQGGLPVLVGGEVLRHRGGNGLVARHDALDQTTHGFDAQRQRNHVEQQQLAIGVVARQLVGLNGSAQRHHFVRVEVVQRGAAQQVGHSLLHLRHAGGAAHHDHALNLVFAELGIAQGFAHGRQGALGQGPQWLLQTQRVSRCGSMRRTDNATSNVAAVRCGQRFFASTRSHQHIRFIGGRGNGAAGLALHPSHQSAVVVVATQRRIAARGQHFKHATRQTQNRNIKGAATEVIHRIHTFTGLIQAIGNSCGRGFVDEAQAR